MARWLREQPLHTRVSRLLALSCFLGALFIAARHSGELIALNPVPLMTQTFFVSCLIVGVFFVVTSTIYSLRYLQPALGLFVACLNQLTDPGDSASLYFMIVSASLLVKYGFFERRPLPRVVGVILIITASGVIGALIPRPVGTMFYQLGGVDYLLRYPFMNICLAAIELGIFWEDLQPRLFPGPTPEPTYFVAEEHRLTEREFEILAAVVRSNGASSKVLADQLGLEEGSINAAMSKIYKKLDIAHTKVETISLLSKSRLFYYRKEADEDRRFYLQSMARK